MWALLGFGAAVPLVWCFVLGAILAPTDAVVVESLLRRAGLPASLRGTIVGESLFNAGAAVVLFLLALGVTQGDTIHLGHGHVLMALLREIAGGALLGIIAGWLAALLLRRIDDDGLQLLISLALALCWAATGWRSSPTCRAPSRWSRPGSASVRRRRGSA